MISDHQSSSYLSNGEGNMRRVRVQSTLVTLSFTHSVIPRLFINFLRNTHNIMTEQGGEIRAIPSLHPLSALLTTSHSRHESGPLELTSSVLVKHAMGAVSGGHV